MSPGLVLRHVATEADAKSANQVAITAGTSLGHYPAVTMIQALIDIHHCVSLAKRFSMLLHMLNKLCGGHVSICNPSRQAPVSRLPGCLYLQQREVENITSIPD